jgi:hypothetical protein
MTLRELLKTEKQPFRIKVHSASDPNAYAKLHGVWFHLYCRKEQEVCELPTPQSILIMQTNTDIEAELYTGPLDKNDG